VNIVSRVGHHDKSEEISLMCKETRALCTRFGLPLAREFQTFFTDERFAENIIGRLVVYTL